MPRLAVLAGCALLLLAGWAGPCPAQDLTGAPILAKGDPTAPGRDSLAAAPGTRFGLQLLPEGEPKGAPVTLLAVLTPPGGENGTAEPIRWEVPAWIGQPVWVTWAFAYAWEITPGTWTLEAFHADRRLTGAAFEVTPAPLKAAPEPAQAAKSTPKAPDTQRAAPKAAPSSQATRKLEAPQTPPEAAKPRAKVLVSGPPERAVYAVSAGVFSEEARARWYAVLLKGQGAKACVRQFERDGRKRYAVILGWRDTMEDARKLRQDMSRLAGDLAVTPLSAGELARGLDCR